jgi:uncharacterized protein (TIGR00661 family)
VESAPMASTLYAGGRVDLPGTFLHAMRVFRSRGAAIRRTAAIIEDFDPNLILSDYEYFTPLAARRAGRTCVSLDHQHILTHCLYPHPKGQFLSRWLTCSIVRHLYSACERFLVLSFFHFPPRDPNVTEVLPPVLRREVLRREPSDGDHILVYLNPHVSQGLLPMLGSTDRRVVVHGLGRRPARGNLLFKAPSTEEFLVDLASCCYVVANAGHTLMSEALHYGKPVLSFPVPFAYEQYINAHFLECMGFGKRVTLDLANGAVLDGFESRLGEYRSRIRTHHFAGNEEVTARLEALIGGG